jgi:CBS domain-containing protein
MQYFSEVKNKKVLTDDGLYVGKLVDLVFTFTHVAQVTKLLVRSDVLKEAFHVPIENLLTINDDDIVISKAYVNYELEENELYVDKNLIDKQIIDIEGRKVVRVNDAVIQIKRSNNILITGVDIGLSAIFRWFGIEGLFEGVGKILGLKITPHILSWKDVQPLELAAGKVVLNTPMENLDRFHPEDLADYLETTDLQNMIKMLDLVDKEFASEVIAEMNLNYQIAIFEQLGIVKTVKILLLMDPDEAVDVLLQFSDDKRRRIMDKLPEDVREDFAKLISVSQTTVGQYMTSEFLYVYKDENVTEITRKVQKYTNDFDFLFYVYVVNKQQQLIGVFSLHELLMQKVNTPAYKFMQRNTVLAYLNTPIQTVIKRMITYKLYGLPVVGKDKKLIGTVLLDDIDDVLLEELQ